MTKTRDTAILYVCLSTNNRGILYEDTIIRTFHLQKIAALRPSFHRHDDLYFHLRCRSAPLVSYHYGAGNHDELKNLFGKSLRLIGIWGLMLFILAQLIARPLAAIFVGYDADLFSMTQNGFRIYCIAYLINGFNIYGSSFFTALNNGLISAAISFLRTLVFQLAAVLLLPLLLGINGIWSAVAVAELLTLGLTVTFFVRNRKKYHYA